MLHRFLHTHAHPASIPSHAAHIPRLTSRPSIHRLLSSADRSHHRATTSRSLSLPHRLHRRFTGNPSNVALSIDLFLLTLIEETGSDNARQITGNPSNVDNLSWVRVLENPNSQMAVSVASQWLELLHQDIKGRLAALRRSGKRIQTELPFLVSQELVSKQENDCCAVRNSENGHFNEGTADLHRARCDTIFDQMDNALSEEEKHLESSLNQVNEMMMHCRHGLLQFDPENGLQQRTTDYSYMQNYGPLVEQDSSASKYAKFTAQSLEKMLTSLFLPKPMRHGSFKVRQHSSKFSNGVEDQYSASPTPTIASA